MMRRCPKNQQTECPLCKRHGRVPNAKTRAAIREAQRGGLPRFKDVASLMAELNAFASGITMIDWCKIGRHRP